ncbi:hypothetical protein SteCoe_12236 [Stentor coeruleus]|uniref:Ubiquitin fusion degradation protein UFD1 N-terminal subdomain 1 domain-containing protein n=1 Tax=Stentor coeruleus TaxID=5963 RepID=A0A1R2CB92_9CILI|nr:hypothetical protein SteCoe_12236 [Stentor coeruleus]
MRISQTLNNPYLHQFSRILPLSCHENYNEDLEYSDKVILPATIFLIIRQCHLPLPPVFTIKSLRDTAVPIICGSFEFTAEEDTIYCPDWMLKKLSRRNKYYSGDVLIEILQSRKKNTYTFPLLKKIEIMLDESIEPEHCRKGLQLYTVLIKGEKINLILQNKKIIKASIVGLLPKNKCLVKNNNFEIVVIQKPLEILNYEKNDEVRPLIQSLPISLLSKAKMMDKRKTEAYTPWEHRVQPIRLEGESVDLLPWDKEDIPLRPPEVMKNEVTTQTLPEIALYPSRPVENFKKKHRKILSMAFPLITVPDFRPLTTLEIDFNYKSASHSPVTLRLGKNHRKSVY